MFKMELPWTLSFSISLIVFISDYQAVFVYEVQPDNNVSSKSKWTILSSFNFNLSSFLVGKSFWYPFWSTAEYFLCVSFECLVIKFSIGASLILNVSFQNVSVLLLTWKTDVATWAAQSKSWTKSYHQGQLTHNTRAGLNKHTVQKTNKQQQWTRWQESKIWPIYGWSVLGLGGKQWSHQIFMVQRVFVSLYHILVDT